MEQVILKINISKDKNFSWGVHIQSLYNTEHMTKALMYE